MSSTPTEAEPSRGVAIATHLCLVGTSFMISFVLMQGVGLMPGEVLECFCFMFLGVHAAAAALSLVFRRVTVQSGCIIFALAFFPTGGCQVLSNIREAYCMRYVLPSDRFRDSIAPTIPNSVSNLYFVPLSESKRPDLMFRFDIAPADLDEILKQMKMRRVPPDKFLRHDDFFMDPDYLPLGEADEVYQAKDEWGTVKIIKTNKEHTRAIFRKG